MCLSQYFNVLSFDDDKYKTKMLNYDIGLTMTFQVMLSRIVLVPRVALEQECRRYYLCSNQQEREWQDGSNIRKITEKNLGSLDCIKKHKDGFWYSFSYRLFSYVWKKVLQEESSDIFFIL